MSIVLPWFPRKVDSLCDAVERERLTRFCTGFGTMLGLLAAIGRAQEAIQELFRPAKMLIADAWVYVEHYGWRVMIGSVALFHFASRVAHEANQRKQARRALHMD